jgi:threo-3-hydroxy-L-aspartate ammonia-lyase
MVTFSDIENAYTRIASIVHLTPLLTSRTLNSQAGNFVWCKAESLQRIGAFKIRGAYNKIASLSSEERRRGVVAHSSGNHAQGVSLASSLLGVKATIVMPKNAPAIKVEATKSYGAEVVRCDDSSDDRERVARDLMQRHGYVEVPPYDDPHIIAGQGTTMIEIGRALSKIDYLFVPVGGGGLISGCAIAAKHLFPSIKVIGVETDAANDCCQSFRQKTIVRIAPPKTIADGMRTQSVGRKNFEIIMKYVDDVISIPDEFVLRMMRFFLQRMKIMVEPTGAVAPAAVYHNVLGISDKNICAIISGGNADPALIARALETS